MVSKILGFEIEALGLQYGSGSAKGLGFGGLGV